MRISEEGQEITNRFFETLTILKQNKELKNLNDWCLVHNIDRRNLMFVKANPATSVLKPEWIYYLCHDFSLKTEYLIFGIGDMYIRQE